MARMVERDQDDRSFDIEFWQKIGTEGIWDAMWAMTREVDLMRGGDGRGPRMDRTKERIIYRERRLPGNRKPK